MMMMVMNVALQSAGTHTFNGTISHNDDGGCLVVMMIISIMMMMMIR